MFGAYGKRYDSVHAMLEAYYAPVQGAEAHGQLHAKLAGVVAGAIKKARGKVRDLVSKSPSVFTRSRGPVCACAGASRSLVAAGGAREGGGMAGPGKAHTLGAPTCRWLRELQVASRGNDDAASRLLPSLCAFAPPLTILVPEGFPPALHARYATNPHTAFPVRVRSTSRHMEKYH